MIDANEYEKDAMGHAGDRGGEYLDSLGKTDLATMSVEEWKTFIDVVCSGYTERLAEIATKLSEDAKAIQTRIAL